MHIIKNKKRLTYIEYLPIYRGLNIVEFGEETNTRDTFIASLCYRHNYIIHFVLDGHGEFYCDNRTYPLSAGQAFVITPKNLIRYEPAKNDSWTYCWLAFSGIDCDAVFEQCGLIGVPVFKFENEMIEPLREMIEQLRVAPPENETAFSFSVSAMANEVLKNCVLALHPQVAKPKIQPSDIIEQSISYMHENFHKPINISILCKDLHVSRGYFSTLFESIMKQSPYQFLLTLRLQRAAELLLTNQTLRVYEIAEIVGFSSTAQFCKAFQKANQLSPSGYRKKYSTNAQKQE